MEDLKIKKPKLKAQELKPAKISSSMTKTSEKAWKEYKMRFQKEKRKHKNSNSGTLITRVNTNSN